MSTRGKVDFGSLLVGAFLTGIGASMLWFLVLADANNYRELAASRDLIDQALSFHGAIGLALGAPVTVLGLLLFCLGIPGLRIVVFSILPAHLGESGNNENEAGVPGIRSQAGAESVAAWFAVPIVLGFLSVFGKPRELWEVTWSVAREVVSTSSYLPALESWRDLALMALYLAGAMAVLGWALYATWSWRRFGELLLHLDPYPGSIDGDVGGSIDLGAGLDLAHPVTIKLKCMKVSRNSKGAKSYVTQWSDERRFLPEKPVGGRSRLLFRFRIPADLPETCTTCAWKIEMSCEVPGVNLARGFWIPVSGKSQRMHGANRVREQASNVD